MTVQTSMFRLCHLVVATALALGCSTPPPKDPGGDTGSSPKQDTGNVDTTSSDAGVDGTLAPDAATTLCDRARAVTEDECGIEPTMGGESPQCEGDALATARCITDNPAAYCEWLDELQAGDFEHENEYTRCLDEAGVTE